MKSSASFEKCSMIYCTGLSIGALNKGIFGGVRICTGLEWIQFDAADALVASIEFGTSR